MERAIIYFVGAVITTALSIILLIHYFMYPTLQVGSVGIWKESCNYSGIPVSNVQVSFSPSPAIINGITTTTVTAKVTATASQQGWAYVGLSIAGVTYCAEIWFQGAGTQTVSGSITLPISQPGNYTVDVTVNGQTYTTTTLTVVPPPMPTELYAKVPPYQGCVSELGAWFYLVLPSTPPVSIAYPLNVTVEYDNESITQSLTATYTPGYGNFAGAIWNMQAPVPCNVTYTVIATYDDPWGRGSLTTTFTVPSYPYQAPPPPPPGVGVVGISAQPEVNPVMSGETFGIAVTVYLNATPSGSVEVPFLVSLFGVNETGYAYGYGAAVAYGYVVYTAPNVTSTTTFTGYAYSGPAWTTFNVTVLPPPTYPHFTQSQVGSILSKLWLYLLLLLLLLVGYGVLKELEQGRKQRRRGSTS